MRIGMKRHVAVVASLMFALSGGVALADELPDVQPAASEVTTAEVGTTQAAGVESSAEIPETGEVVASDDARAYVGANNTGVGADEADDGEKEADVKGADKSGAEESKADGGATVVANTPDAKPQQESQPVTDAKSSIDDVALEAQVATFWKSENIGWGASATPLDGSTIEWVPIDASIPADVSYIDEDGYRIFYNRRLSPRINNVAVTTIKSKDGGKYYSWVKIGENGELLVPAESNEDFTLDTENFSLRSNSSHVGYVIHYDAVKDALVPYNMGFAYGGEDKSLYQAFLYYKSAQDKELGRLTLGEGAASLAGTSSREDEASPDSHAASLVSYESGTSTFTPATGTSYVSPSAAETIPATSDATSLAGVVFSAIGGLAALGMAKVTRRKS